MTSTTPPQPAPRDAIDIARGLMRLNLDKASQMAVTEVVAPVAFLFLADAEGERKMLLVPLAPIAKPRWSPLIDQLLRQNGGYAYGIISEATARKGIPTAKGVLTEGPGQDIILASFEAVERSITWFRNVSPETTLPHRTLGPIEILDGPSAQGRLVGLGALGSAA